MCLLQLWLVLYGLMPDMLYYVITNVSTPHPGENPARANQLSISRGTRSVNCQLLHKRKWVGVLTLSIEFPDYRINKDVWWSDMASSHWHLLFFHWIISISNHIYKLSTFITVFIQNGEKKNTFLYRKFSFNSILLDLLLDKLIQDNPYDPVDSLSHPIFLNSLSQSSMINLFNSNSIVSTNPRKLLNVLYCILHTLLLL